MTKSDCRKNFHIAQSHEIVGNFSAFIGITKISNLFKCYWILDILLKATIKDYQIELRKHIFKRINGPLRTIFTRKIMKIVDFLDSKGQKLSWTLCASKNAVNKVGAFGKNSNFVYCMFTGT